MPLEAPVITAVFIAPTLAGGGRSDDWLKLRREMSKTEPGAGAEISVSSRLDASPAAVWDRVMTPEGISDEMRPYLRMTLPREVERLDPESIEVGRPIGRSWILLFGLLPFDYDEVCLTRLEPGRGFLERSKMLSQRRWEHERTLEAAAGGCLTTDRVGWEPRLGLPGAPLRPIVAWFFRHRHKRLRRHFGGSPA
jgi:hypothetical protein